MGRTTDKLLDLALAPFSGVGGLSLKAIRTLGIQRFPVHRTLLERLGVFPIRDHYHEPAYTRRDLATENGVARPLPGIDLNDNGQLALLAQLDYGPELKALPLEDQGDGGFHYHNRFFGAGDAEYLYSLIRHLKPARLTEIGSGFSTLVARKAIERNTADDPAYRCHHHCIEPYENDWLEALDVELVREPLQQVPLSTFEELGPDDILFIDSSHVIRPGGDVLREYHEILPLLAPGVYVHIHDIFTPADYLSWWLSDEVRMWNEQYLLEAFLAFNHSFEVVAGLNYLAKRHREELGRACPILAAEPNVEPGSFWIRRSR